MSTYNARLYYNGTASGNIVVDYVRIESAPKQILHINNTADATVNFTLRHTNHTNLALFTVAYTSLTEFVNLQDKPVMRFELYPNKNRVAGELVWAKDIYLSDITFSAANNKNIEKFAVNIPSGAVAADNYFVQVKYRQITSKTVGTPTWDLTASPLKTGELLVSDFEYVYVDEGASSTLYEAKLVFDSSGTRNWQTSPSAGAYAVNSAIRLKNGYTPLDVDVSKGARVKFTMRSTREAYFYAFTGNKYASEFIYIHRTEDDSTTGGAFQFLIFETQGRTTDTHKFIKAVAPVDIAYKDEDEKTGLLDSFTIDLPTTVLEAGKTYWVQLRLANTSNMPVDRFSNGVYEYKYARDMGYFTTSVTEVIDETEDDVEEPGEDTSVPLSDVLGAVSTVRLECDSKKPSIYAIDKNTQSVAEIFRGDVAVFELGLFINGALPDVNLLSRLKLIFKAADGELYPASDGELIMSHEASKRKTATIQLNQTLTLEEWAAGASTHASFPILTGALPAGDVWLIVKGVLNNGVEITFMSSRLRVIESGITNAISIPTASPFGSIIQIGSDWYAKDKDTGLYHMLELRTIGGVPRFYPLQEGISLS